MIVRDLGASHDTARKLVVRNAVGGAFGTLEEIASEIFHLAHEPRDAWSFAAEARQFQEAR